MAQLRLDYEHFFAQDTEVIVVGPEGPRQFQSYWEKEGLPFIGLPDPTYRVLKLYGQEVNLFKFGRMPAQVIIDKHGRVRFVHYGKAMMDIPENQELLELLEELNQEYEVV